MKQETKDMVIALVCEKTGVSKADLMANGRIRKYAHARFLAAYVMRTNFLVNTSDLGAYFSRDRSVVSYYCIQAKRLIEAYPDKRQEYEEIKQIVCEWSDAKSDINDELFAEYAKQKHTIRNLNEEVTKLRERVKILESVLSIEQKMKIA